MCTNEPLVHVRPIMTCVGWGRMTILMVLVCTLPIPSVTGTLCTRCTPTSCLSVPNTSSPLTLATACWPIMDTKMLQCKYCTNTSTWRYVERLADVESEFLFYFCIYSILTRPLLYCAYKTNLVPTSITSINWQLLKCPLLIASKPEVEIQFIQLPWSLTFDTFERFQLQIKMPQHHQHLHVHVQTQP